MDSGSRTSSELTLTSGANISNFLAHNNLEQQQMILTVYFVRYRDQHMPFLIWVYMLHLCGIYPPAGELTPPLTEGIYGEHVVIAPRTGLTLLINNERDIAPVMTFRPIGIHLSVGDYDNWVSGQGSFDMVPTIKYLEAFPEFPAEFGFGDVLDQLPQCACILGASVQRLHSRDPILIRLRTTKDYLADPSRAELLQQYDTDGCETRDARMLSINTVSTILSGEAYLAPLAETPVGATPLDVPATHRPPPLAFVAPPTPASAPSPTSSSKSESPKGVTFNVPPGAGNGGKAVQKTKVTHEDIKDASDALKVKETELIAADLRERKRIRLNQEQNELRAQRERRESHMGSQDDKMRDRGRPGSPIIHLDGNPGASGKAKESGTADTDQDRGKDSHRNDRDDMGRHSAGDQGHHQGQGVEGVRDSRDRDRDREQGSDRHRYRDYRYEDDRGNDYEDAGVGGRQDDND
jgi:hypothetical protein